MKTEEVLDYSEKQIAEFKRNNAIELKKNINQEIKKVQEAAPRDILDAELSLKVEEEVNLKLRELNESIDLNPTALYHALKAESALDPEVSEEALTVAAYQFLIKKTKNRFLKKILKENLNSLAKEK